MSETIYLYAGPTLFDSGLLTDTPTASRTDRRHGIVWLPPARRGDVEKLLARQRKPGVIGLADGTFHSYPAIGHVELREAIEAGWRVYGLCSMGAIRASEMAHMGMIPWGRVAEMYCKNPDLADDEVALLHGADAPYAPLSEPMLHLREFCDRARGKGLIDAGQYDIVVNSLKNRWYGKRTIENMMTEFSSLIENDDVRRDLLSLGRIFHPYRLKQADLISFVSDRPWIERGEND